MESKKIPLLEQSYWPISHHITPSLHGKHASEVVIVGGGMAGLHAAQAFIKRGRKVILIEKNYCGAGASGRSSGFITPDSEYSLHEFIETYGPVDGKKFWDFVTGGVTLIRDTINHRGLKCDMVQQDTCVVANSKHAFTSDLVKEHETRKKMGYASQLYTANEVPRVVGSPDYYGAVRYNGSFGINGFAYCQELKKALMRDGLTVYEDTPAVTIDDHTVKTPYGEVQADHVVLCVDHFLPSIVSGPVADAVYQVQTFLMISEPLNDWQASFLFPSGPLMVWDTDLIYTYYRLTGDNRLLLGGGSLWTLYASHEQHGNHSIRRQLLRYVERKFPGLNPTFSYFWAGLIGVSKDIVPLAGAFEDRPWLYYVGAGAGLPWAAAMGEYSAAHILEGKQEMDRLLSPYRSFPVGGMVQKVIGKRLSFAISQGKALFL